MSKKSQSGQEIELREAEMLGRQFNTAMTNTMAYGADHDVPSRAIDNLVEGLTTALSKRPSVTLILDREFLYIEQHIINRKFNAARLINLFRRIGVESVTFGQGVERGALGTLLTALSEPDENQDPDAVTQVLESAGVTTVRINHIVYRKVTSEEEVVTHDELESLTDLSARAVLRSGGEPGGSNSAGGGIETDILEKMSAVFTLKDLMAQPDRIANSVLEAAGDADAETRADTVARIRAMAEEISSGGQSTDTPVSLAEIMTSVHTLRVELQDGLEAQKQIGRFFAEDDPVIDEIDQLTYRTILSLVREEYRSGDFSVKRLAQLLRRMLPDIRDLKRLLPQLKKTLLEEGMSLQDYLACVNELTSELRNESLVRALEEGADDIGLSVDEIMHEIQRDPEEAARLMVLAAELRQGGAEDEARLSEVMAEYIERISGKMAARPQGGAPADSGGTLRKVVGRIQSELVEKLKKQGIPAHLAARVDEQLQGRFQKTLDSIKSEWLIELAAKADDMPRRDLIRSVEQVLERKSDMDTLAEPLNNALNAHGLSQQEIEATTGGIAERFRHRGGGERPMAAKILNAEDTKWFLEREIKSRQRYETQFACIMMMLAAVKFPEQPWRPVTRDDNETLVPELIRTAASELRDLDFMGTIEATGQSVPMIILPMTPEDGAVVVKRRLLEAVDGTDFPLGSEMVQIKAAVSACGFDPERTPDMKSFIQALRGRLAGELVAVSKRTRE